MERTEVYLQFNRAEGVLSSVAVRSGARIFECPVSIHTYIHTTFVMPPGRMVGAGARTLATQD